MLEWMNQNSGALNVLVGVGTLLVWLLYFELLLSNYRRQKRSKILLLSDGNHTWKGRFLISNMSANPVYVEMVHVRLELEGGHVAQAVLTAASPTSSERASRLESLKQGPLGVSEWSELGSFEDLARCVVANGRAEGAPLQAIRRMEITVGAVYAAEDRMVGARRTYRCKGDLVSPEAVSTAQLRGRRDRRELTRLLAQAYEDA